MENDNVPYCWKCGTKLNEDARANLELTIHDGVGAAITSGTSFERVNTNLTGLSGIQSPWQSNHYPASSNFIALKTATGGINIDATCESEGHT